MKKFRKTAISYRKVMQMSCFGSISTNSYLFAKNMPWCISWFRLYSLSKYIHLNSFSKKFNEQT